MNDVLVLGEFHLVIMREIKRVRGIDVDFYIVRDCRSSSKKFLHLAKTEVEAQAFVHGIMVAIKGLVK